MVARRLQSHRRLCTTAGLWLAVFAIGLIGVHSGPYLAHPNAHAAKRAFLAVLDGALPSAGDFASFLIFAFATLVKPIGILAAIFLLEHWLCPRQQDRRQLLLVWSVQLLFLTAFALLMLAVAQLPWLPPPLFPRGSEDAYFALLPAAMMLGSLLMTDVLGYWLHRACHRFAFLWRFHKLHHAQELDVVRNVSHPVETLITFVLVVFPVSLFFNVPGQHLYLIAGFIILTSHLTHTRLPIHLGRFGVLYADNRFHFIHHGLDPETYNTNFAAHFPFIDMLFGTYRAPQGEALPPTGLREHTGPRTFRDYILVDLAPRQAAREPQPHGALQIA